MSDQKDGWRPIESAPKDGTYILAYPIWGPPHEVAEIYWQVMRRESRWAIPFGPACVRQPTHWMPLPEPPK
jgi:hypothetical protein